MDNVCIAIKKFGILMRTRRNKDLKKYGITGAQADTLDFLFGRDGKETSQKEISEYFGIRHTSTIELLKHLEEKELIRKEVNSQNAKYRNITLTAKGRTIVEECKEERSRINGILSDGFTPEEIETMEEFMERLLDSVKNRL